MPLLALIACGLFFGAIIISLLVRLKQTEETLRTEISTLEEKLKTTESNLINERDERIHAISINTTTKNTLDELGIAIIFINNSGTITYMNPAAERLCRIEEKVARQKSFSQMCRLTNLTGQADHSVLDTALAGKIVAPIKWLNLQLPTGQVPVYIRAQPVKDTNNRVTQVIITLEDASEKVASDNEAKAFFSAAAHELRTPLTIIKSTISLLSESFSQQPPEKIKELLLSISDSTEQLIKLVNDFLSVSRIEQNRLDVHQETFDVVGLIREAVNQYQKLAQDKHLYLNFHTEIGRLDINSDKGKLQEILVNLISNAIKYTFQGGITISENVEGNTVEIKVADTGMGIPKDTQALLFRKFQQIGIARTQSQTKTTGLGLYLAKRLAMLIGGDLILEKSEPGVGSTFVFHVPIRSG